MSLDRTEGGADKEKVQRLFFALWPDETLRQGIKRNCKTLLRHGGGRPVVPENLHITLVFLGNVDSSQRACAEQVADGLICSPFSLTLDQAGHWSKPRVLWIGASVIPEILSKLVADLYQGIRQCGLQLDSRPYRAHLTLMRKVNRPPAELYVQPLEWQVDRFVLVKSTTYPEGVKYEVVKEWALSETG